MAPMWSNLPADILYAIASLLNSDLHLLRLRSVCSSWRSSLSPLPPKQFSFPLKVPPLRAFYGWGCPNRLVGYFVLKEYTFYRLSPPTAGASAGDPSSGWLVKVSETKPNTFALRNPLSGRKIKDTQGIIPKHLNLLDYRISEICKSYSLGFAAKVPQRSRSYIVRKIIVLQNYVAGCDFCVLALRYGGGIESWKFGDENWTCIDTKSHHFEGLIFCHGKCYAIDMAGVIVYFDSKLNMTETGLRADYLPGQQNYLVEYRSELLVVSKTSFPLNGSIGVPLTLKIFKVSKDWGYIGNLEDEILLLGDDVSLAISTKDFAGCKGNCVYLTDGCFFDDGKDSVYGDVTGVYDLDNRRVEALVNAQEYARIFWPPPSWLPPDESSSRC